MTHQYIAQTLEFWFGMLYGMFLARFLFDWKPFSVFRKKCPFYNKEKQQ